MKKKERVVRVPVKLIGILILTTSRQTEASILVPLFFSRSA